MRRRVVDDLGRSRAPAAIAPLLLAVADEIWSVRQAASDHLAGFDPTTLLPALETALRDHDNATMRNAAMEIYVRLGAAATPALIALLTDADDEVRTFAAVMLGTLREQRAVGPLIATLRDATSTPPRSRRQSGTDRLARAVPALIAALRSEAWLQYPAIYALGEIGDARANSALLELLDDEPLRAAVLEALASVGGRDALPRVIPSLHDPDPNLRTAAIRCVVAIEQRATAQGESLDPRVQAALGREDLIEHLLRALDDDDLDNRKTAAITLGWLREPRAEHQLIELLGEPALEDYVAHALVCIGFQDKQAYVAGLNHPADPVRQGTVRCLAWIGPPDERRRWRP